MPGGGSSARTARRPELGRVEAAVPPRGRPVRPQEEARVLADAVLLPDVHTDDRPGAEAAPEACEQHALLAADPLSADPPRAAVAAAADHHLGSARRLHAEQGEANAATGDESADGDHRERSQQLELAEPRLGGRALGHVDTAEHRAGPVD